MLARIGRTRFARGRLFTGQGVVGLFRTGSGRLAAGAVAALAVGLAMRRFLPTHPFVYVLGRAFFGTMLVLVPCGLLRAVALHTGALTLPTADLAIAQWLLSWGEATLTGMLAAALMVYRPSWLATFTRPAGWPESSSA